jgi:uncharacterized protein YjiS (DUF1127 family)
MTQTLNNFFKKLINNYQMAKAIRQTENELRKLTDAELNDIGIARGDIYSIARQDMGMKITDTVIKASPAPFNPNLKGFV